MELPAIVSKMYELANWIILKISKMSKEQKYILGSRIENQALDILDSLIEASLIGDSESKLKILAKTNINLEKLRFGFRIINDQRLINEKSYFYFNEKIIEIGRDLFSWIKFIESKRNS